MWRNSLKSAFRNLLRHRTHAFINIFSLTIGLTASIFIFLWVLDEQSYDKFHEDDKHLYKVLINNTLQDGSIQTHGATPARLKEAILEEIPEVTMATQNNISSKLLIQYEDKSFNENGLYADPEMFTVFSFPLINGSRANALPDINAIAISQKLANKFFADENAVGKILRVDQSHELMVSAVFADIPGNSSLQFDFVIPFELYYRDNPWMQNWWTGGTSTYLRLEPDASQEAVNQKLAGLIQKNCATCTNNPFLFSFSKLYLNNGFENGQNTGGRIEQVILFSVVAVIILIMACINFMNLATARSTTRSKEVSIRKIVGANQPGLIIHFIMEAMLMAFSALLLAVVIVQLGIPFFNDITSKSVQLNFSDPVFIGGALLITIISGLLAGFYPALLLSSFKPLQALKSNVRSMLSGNGLRKTLVVVQFSAAVILIISSIIIYQQINFISNKNLGFSKERVIVMDVNDDLAKNYRAFKSELIQFHTIDNMGFGGNDIFSIPITTTDLVWPGKVADSNIQFKLFRCDEGFIPTLDISLLKGRNFLDAQQDASNFIVNRKAMEVMGLNENEVIGTEITLWGTTGRIVGLSDDFHNDNLKMGIEPLVFLYSENLGWHYFVKLNKNVQLQDALADMEKVVKQYSPDHPFEFNFLDELFDKQYRSELVLSKLSLSFTLIAIMISCLGLFGLATFTAERRIKELGIRKILGASVVNLVVMLCADFTKLIGISLLIGSPVAWYLSESYLSEFAFRTEVQISIFILAALGLFTIAIVTVGFQSARAALMNPTDTLRSE